MVLEQLPPLGEIHRHASDLNQELFMSTFTSLYLKMNLSIQTSLTKVKCTICIKRIHGG